MPLELDNPCKLAHNRDVYGLCFVGIQNIKQQKWINVSQAPHL